ncbi:hypothetical protein T01_7097 [Trichinella spiralis]|uniref:Uncharacterized protein n=1 Tax=Trichinella spiralis TaxID=6334 RepID=A0A0V1BZP2_TRISP|nr:hypothetical protein T01_7097 [Trichinella spiralis]
MLLMDLQINCESIIWTNMWALISEAYAQYQWTLINHKLETFVGIITVVSKVELAMDSLGCPHVAVDPLQSGHLKMFSWTPSNAFMDSTLVTTVLELLSNNCADHLAQNSIHLISHELRHDEILYELYINTNEYFKQTIKPIAKCIILMLRL